MIEKKTTQFHMVHLAALLLICMVSCGPIQKDAVPSQDIETDLQLGIRDERADCFENRPPTQIEAFLNKEVFCEVGLAHLIVHAEDPDTERVEYRVDVGGVVLEKDEESPSAFYSEILDPHLSYVLQIAAGDGCDISLATILLDGMKFCNEKSSGASDDAYIGLPTSRDSMKARAGGIHGTFIASVGW